MIKVLGGNISLRKAMLFVYHVCLKYPIYEISGSSLGHNVLIVLFHIHLVEEKIAIFAAANSNDFTKSNAKYQLGTASSANMTLLSHHSYISHSQKAIKIQ